MNKCSKCGAPLGCDDVFCPKCGTIVVNPDSIDATNDETHVVNGETDEKNISSEEPQKLFCVDDQGRVTREEWIRLGCDPYLFDIADKENKGSVSSQDWSDLWDFYNEEMDEALDYPESPKPYTLQEWIGLGLDENVYNIINSNHKQEITNEDIVNFLGSIYELFPDVANANYEDDEDSFLENTLEQEEEEEEETSWIHLLLKALLYIIGFLILQWLIDSIF